MNNIKSRLVVFVFCIVACVTYSLGQSVGNASYYARSVEGHRTANGDIYHNDSMTCAHLKYPFGTILKVRNLKNEKVVYVKVNDRGPYSKRRIIDLSYGAAEKLEMIKMGICPVEITVCKEPFKIPYKNEEPQRTLPKIDFMQLVDFPQVPQIFLTPSMERPIEKRH